MNPQIAKSWADAECRLKTAKQYFDVGKLDLAKSEARNAAVCGLIASLFLFDKSENERDIAIKAHFEFSNDIETKHHAPKETIEKAYRFLKFLSELSPLDAKLPMIQP